MTSIRERYISVTRDAKRAIQNCDNAQRSSEEQRVYKAFRKHARDAYRTLKTVTRLQC